MNLESQVVSLELAKKLKKLNIGQQSIFYWIGTNNDNIMVYGLTYFLNVYNEYIKFEEIYLAFTAAELMDITPYYIDTRKDEPFNNFRFNLTIHHIVEEKTNRLVKVYSINYHCDSATIEIVSPFFAHTLYKHNIYDENLANCLAKNLIFLIENGYINNKLPTEITSHGSGETAPDQSRTHQDECTSVA